MFVNPAEGVGSRTAAEETAVRTWQLQLVVSALLGAVLTACAKGSTAPTAPPAEAAVVTQPAAATPAPSAPIRPSPEGFQVKPALNVEVVNNGRLYTGRGTFYLPVTEVAAGTKVEYLDSREGWLYVRTASGDAGWLRAADATVRDGRNQPITYRVNTGRWGIEVESGLKIEVARAGTGVMRLVATGIAGDPKAQPLSDGSLVLTGTVTGGVQSALGIGDSGLGQISLSERGLLLELENNPVYRVLIAEPGRVEVEIRPGLERVERIAAGWALQIRGDLRPVLRQQGSELILDLPGALRAETLTDVPEGITLADVAPEGGATTAQGQPSSLNATVPDRMPLGGLRLRLAAPATPYALYRPAPGRIELRFLTTGLAGKTILVDPGHGGEESGAVGVAGNIEKDVNLDVALLLKPLLEQAGARVIMTRTTDARVLSPELAAKYGSHSERTQADLAARSTLANQEQADMFISIHNNAGPPGDGGTETFWAISNLNAARSQYLAGLMQRELVDALGFYDRGVKQRPFNVIRNSYAPGVLVELGFMTSGFEESVLVSRSGQEAAARALFRAVQAYFGE